MAEYTRQKKNDIAHIQSNTDYGSTLWDSANAITIKPLVSLKSSEVTLCGWRGYKPSINKYIGEFTQ